MSDKSRRKLLKSIAAGSGAIVAGKSLPESWSRPVVDSVMLPAHAMTSLITTHAGQTTQRVAQLDTDSMFAEVLDTLVPEAKAQPPAADVTYDYCITPNADRTAANFIIVVTWIEDSGCTHNAKYHLDNVPIVTLADSSQLMIVDWTSCMLGNNGFLWLTSLSGNAVGRFECGCGTYISDFNLPLDECNLPSMQICGDGCTPP
jgi:hypothetical protein